MMNEGVALKAWTVAALAAFGACAPGSGGDSGVSIDYERYEFENGLDVILHVDRSDPIAAVAMTFHVGSARGIGITTGLSTGEVR